MRYGTRVLLIFVLLLTVSESISYFVLKNSGNTVITKQMEKRAVSIAAAAAAAIDPEKLKLVRARQDENRPEYEELSNQLKEVRDAVRTGGTYIGYLYTFHQSAQNPEIFLFGVDPEEEFNLKSYPGDIMHGVTARDIPVNRPHVHPSFRTDEWGTWLIGRYPVRDANGDFVAYVAADIRKSDVEEAQSAAHIYALYEIGFQSVFALIAALILSRRLSSTLSKLQGAIHEIDEGKFSIDIPVKSNDEFSEIARSLESMAKGLEERALVKTAFARYVSQHIADSILGSGMQPSVQGERRRVTVLFSDVRGFTTISEKLTPEQIVLILNAYFEKMVDVIFRHKGTLDKFLGDGLMAIFGAPLEDQFQEANAIKAAIDMRRELGELNRMVQEEHGLELAIGIGINSGPAIVGNIGSSQRMEYTAIGDTVNLASRLEAKTKETESNIIISEHTYHSVRGVFPFEFTRLGAVSVRGREDEVTIYSIPENADYNKE